MRELLIQIIQTGGSKIYSLAIGIITLSLTARWLGPEGRGVVASITTWGQVFISIAGLSIGSVLINHATKDHSKVWLGKTMGTLIAYIAAISVVVWLVVVFLYYADDLLGLPSVLGELPPVALFLGFLIVPLGIWELYGQALLNIKNQYIIFNRYQMIGGTFGAFLLVSFVVGAEWGVVGVLLSKLLGQMLVSYGGIRYLFQTAKGSIHANLASFKHLATDGAKLHFHTIGLLMVSSVDILMVNAYLGLEATGYYQLAVQLNELMMILPYAAMTVLNGKVVRAGVYGVWPYQKKLLKIAFLIMLLGSIVAALTAKWWLIWLAGEEFRPAIILFQYLLIGTLVTTSTVILSVQWIARGWLWQLSLSTFILGVANIIFNMLLIPKYGIYGAVWSTLGVLSISAVINIGAFIYWEIDVRRYNNNKESVNI